MRCAWSRMTRSSLPSARCRRRCRSHRAVGCRRLGGHAKRPRRGGGDRLHSDRRQPATVAGLRGRDSRSPAQWPGAVLCSPKETAGGRCGKRAIAARCTRMDSARSSRRSRSLRPANRKSAVPISIRPYAPATLRDFAQAGQPEQRQRSRQGHDGPACTPERGMCGLHRRQPTDRCRPGRLANGPDRARHWSQPAVSGSVHGWW